MDVVKYLTLQEVAHEDKALRLPSSFGFVVHPDGRLFHLVRQYYHGVAIALLEPKKAEEHGIGLPLRDYVDVYKYQDFMFDVADDLGYITVGLSIFNRISYDRSQNISKEQVDTMKKYFYNTGMLEDTFMTNQGDVSGAEAVRNLDAQHTKIKLNGGLHKEVDDVKLIEPDELFN